MDWRKIWKRREAIYVWQAILLILDLNPDSYDYNRFAGRIEPYPENYNAIADEMYSSIDSGELTATKFMLFSAEYPGQWNFSISSILVSDLEEWLIRKKLHSEFFSLKDENILGEKTKGTLLRIIATMAVKGYGHVPGKKRSPTAPEIAKDSVAVLEGKPLDDGTVRTWLMAAEEYMRRDEPE